MSYTLDVHLYQNEEGKLRPTENKVKELNKETDLDGFLQLNLNLCL